MRRRRSSTGRGASDRAGRGRATGPPAAAPEDTRYRYEMWIGNGPEMRHMPKIFNRSSQEPPRISHAISANFQVSCSRLPQSNWGLGLADGGAGGWGLWDKRIISGRNEILFATSNNNNYKQLSEIELSNASGGDPAPAAVGRRANTHTFELNCM